MKRYVLTNIVYEDGEFKPGEFKLVGSVDTCEELIEGGYIDDNHTTDLDGRVVNSNRIRTRYIIIDSKSDSICTLYKVVLRNLSQEHREDRLKKLLDKKKPLPNNR